MEDKRTVCGLDVQFAMHVGPREVLFLLDQKSEDMPYLVGYCDIMPGLGAEQVNELVGGDDYLEAVEEFMSRVQGEIDQVRADRALFDEPQEVFGPAHCLPDSMKHNLEGRVVILKPESLRPEYQNVAHQLIYVTGGFGASPDGHGTAVFGKSVFSGENRDCRRHQVLGVLDPAAAPAWVRPGVCAIIEQKKEMGGKPKTKDRGDGR